MFVVAGLIASIPVARAQSSGATYYWGTATSAPLSDLNPLTASGLPGDVASLMYQDSLMLELSTGQQIPWLATNYSMTNGGKTLTFNLNQNAEWVNGSSVVGHITAQDVVYTFHALMANSSLDTYGIDAYLTNVTALSTYTVQFSFNTAFVMELRYIGIQPIVPYAWHTLVSNISSLGNYDNLNIGHQISAGVYTLTKATASSITFVANTHFWKGTAHIPNLVIVPYKSSSSMTLSFKAGDLTSEIPAVSDYFALNATPHIKNVIQKGPNAYYLWSNDAKAPFNNTYFRIGIAYALNKSQIMNKAEDGLGGRGSFGGESWVNQSWWAAGLPYYNYSVYNAKQMFIKAGLHLQNGFWAYSNNTTVKLNIVDPPVSDWMAAATFIENDLYAVGFQVTESIVPFSTWGTDMFQSNGSAQSTSISYYGETSPFSDPYFILWNVYSPNSFWDAYTLHWSNSTVNSLLNQSAVSTNVAQELTYLKQAQTIIASQVPGVLIGDIGSYYAYNSQKVTGINPTHGLLNPLNLLSMKAVTSAPTTPVSSTIYYVAGAIIVVVIIAGVALVYSRSRKRKKDE
ncbi:MAG: hypothetical protein KIS30_08555 [Thermoplasmata archaeon]|nr:hypothetical protein [Candidatus Sysuiplasma acidicola]MBX8646790.1 hypothetical protein [Candidatus Sysuiplasma acidicola]